MLAVSILEAAQLTRVLHAITDDATSFSDIAKALGWYNCKNELDRSKVQRIIGRLKRAKLVAVECDRHILTEKGKIWSSVCTCFQTDEVGEINQIVSRRFKSEVQQCSIDDMAERTAGERVGVKGFSRRRRCEHSEHP
jgi:Mn-dependent DtxR family transcriptional regulator